nr:MULTISPECIES: RtcB family protein [unclassified Streptomyces]
MFVPGTMSTASYVMTGSTGNPAFDSCCHGAGRVWRGRTREARQDHCRRGGNPERRPPRRGRRRHQRPPHRPSTAQPADPRRDRCGEELHDRLPRPVPRKRPSRDPLRRRGSRKSRRTPCRNRAATGHQRTSPRPQQRGCRRA